MKKPKFSSRLRAKVEWKGQPGSAKAQPYHIISCMQCVCVLQVARMEFLSCKISL